jgi:putative DNA primase/helicase
MALPDIDLDKVPGALRDRDQWLLWRFEQKAGEKKPRKVPYYASGLRRAGKQGAEDDRRALVGFDRACSALREANFDGLGFAFLPGDGLIGIDLDNVIDPETGQVQPRAAGIIEACASFTEYSPSGKGVHIYCLGQTKSRKSNEIGVEMFCGRQFFTVTGRQFPGTKDCVSQIKDSTLALIHDLIEGASARKSSSPSRSAREPRVGTEAGLEASFWARVNAKALQMLPSWVPAMLPKAYEYQGGYRITSADLGRDLQEDLQISPEGIMDFGEERGISPIDLVIQWGPAGKALEAAEWLCARMGVAPESLGGKKRAAHSGDFSGRGAASAGEAGLQATPEPPPWVMESPPPESFIDFVHDAADFTDQFRKNKEGKITPTLYNTLHVLEGDPEWRGVLAFNQFSYRITKRRQMPVEGAELGEWTDIDDVRLQVYLTKTYAFEPKKTTVMDSVMQVAHAYPYHPVREYLNGLKWDGVARLPTMLAKYWGVLSTPESAALQAEDKAAYRRFLTYLELSGTKWLIGAVARIFKPGCKLDTMMVFEGGQGDFKSTAIRALFGDDWFSDSKLKIGDKDALAQMQGKWAYEMAEMDAHRKADDTEFKMFLTTQVDRVRWHYGKRAEDVPRQNIFVGTTNMGQYGKDETGMRRIWPVAVGLFDIEAIRKDRDQLWAEAVHRFRSGETWWVDKRRVVLEAADYPELMPPDDAAKSDQRFSWTEWDLFDEQGESRQIVDAWEVPIIEWLRMHNLEKHYTTAQIMGDALMLDRARWTPPEQKRVAAIMRRLGFRPKKCGPKNARVNAWVRQEEGGNVAP